MNLLFLITDFNEANAGVILGLMKGNSYFFNELDKSLESFPLQQQRSS